MFVQLRCACLCNACICAAMPFCLAQKNQCSPSPVVAALYFCTYMLLVVYLMVQLVSALQGRRIILSPARGARVHLEVVEQRVVQQAV